MNPSRSTFYKGHKEAVRSSWDESRACLRIEIEEILAEWPAYGYRRVTLELRRRGIVVNHKRVAKMRKVVGYAVSRYWTPG